MFRKFVATASPLCLAAAAVKKAEEKKPNLPAKKEIDELAHYKCKPTDLPLYVPLHALNKKKPEEHPVRQPGVIESGIGAVRVELCSAYNVVASQKKSIDEFFEKGKAHSKFIFDYLNEPDNTMPRIGAITIGGLSGFILALRGGFIKRILYTGIGAGAIASICYPEEAGKYAQLSLVEAKKGVNITYNFAFGVKPGDDVETLKLPKFPTNLSELTDSVSDLAKSAKDALFSSKK